MDDGAGMVTHKRPQRTIARDAEIRGVSLLSGANVHLRFHPAEAGTGISFLRADLPGRPAVPAHVRYVVPRQRRTTIQSGAAVVEMVEHVMAALGGLRIDNCVVELDAPETPGCDGSSRAFVEALGAAGIVEQDETRDVLAVDRPITVRDGQAVLTAHPGDGERLVLSYNLDYGSNTPIGTQSRFVDLSPATFSDELAPSRTFLLKAEADALRAAGIGSRVRETDLLVFGPDGPINNELRFPDECVRHKLLDMVGDLALLGKDLAGHVVAHRSGHALNAELVRRLLEAAGEHDCPGCAGDVTPSLDVGAVMELLPHRYPFLLIDRVLELDAPRRVLALKNVTYNEPFFAGHWPGRPIMPGVLILEAIAQAAGVLIAQQFNSHTHAALIAAIDGVRIRRPVVPGDQLRLEVELLRSKLKLFDVDGVARVGDQVAAEARIRFVIVETAGAA
jgi:UDP-3-O-[3-hydroxymyristoyl] N-acetylglucosamine deacetylase/3-hydroxyacyl-[acyl-carrier-protein] dehydratase